LKYQSLPNNRREIYILSCVFEAATGLAAGYKFFPVAGLTSHF
jgi:hypothetical protein